MTALSCESVDMGMAGFVCDDNCFVIWFAERDDEEKARAVVEQLGTVVLFALFSVFNSMFLSTLIHSPDSAC